MLLQHKKKAGFVIVKPGGDRLDAASSIQFKDAMRGIEENNSEPIILDMSEVSFLDSSGLGALVSIWKSLNNGQFLSLANLRPMVVRVFALTRMDGIFRIYDSVEEAISDNPDNPDKPS